MTAATQECCEQYWTGPGGKTPQSSSYTATYHPSRKLSKLDELDMQDTAGEVGTSSLVMYSYEPIHMAEQKQGDQLKPTYCSSVRIRGVALRTCWKRWTIGRGGEKGSELSMLMARQDEMMMIYMKTIIKTNGWKRAPRITENNFVEKIVFVSGKNIANCLASSRS